MKFETCKVLSCLELCRRFSQSVFVLVNFEEKGTQISMYCSWVDLDWDVICWITRVYVLISWYNHIHYEYMARHILISDFHFPVTLWCDTQHSLVTFRFINNIVTLFPTNHEPSYYITWLMPSRVKCNSILLHNPSPSTFIVSWNMSTFFHIYLHMTFALTLTLICYSPCHTIL